MKILAAEAVRAALPMAEAIEAVRWAYLAVSTGQAVLPQRIHLLPPNTDNVTLVMPAHVGASPDGRYPASLAVKTVSVYPGNPALGIATVLGGVLVLDPATGACIGLADAASLTAIRTGAGSGVATALLAREDAEKVAILGAGAQAATQLQAMCAVRQIRTAWVFSRTPARAEAMCARLAGRDGITTDLRIASSASEAIREADIVCTATGSHVPVFQDCDLKLGVHINAVGAFKPDMQEVPAETVGRARVFVDHLSSALQEAGDLVQAIRAGAIGEDDIVGEIGSLLAGDLAGRQDLRQITLFKSVGIAAQDAVCATAAIRNAQAMNLGVNVT